MPLWAVALLLVFGFTGTYAVIPLAKRWAPRWGLVSPPGGRRSHAQDMPLTGGWTLYLPLAVAFLTFFTLALTGTLKILRPEWERMLFLFLGTTWILILGTIDDRLTLGWKQKLAGQFLGGLILVIGGHTVSVANIPWVGTVNFGWYGIPFFLIAVIAITNAINLIDGLDGLAGGICFFAALTSAVIALVKGDLFTATLSFTLSGSLLGFLRFNFPPASIFLGDGGSMMLGFLLGTMAISSTAFFPGQRLGTSIMILVPFLPLGIPLFDAALAVLRRGLTGQALFLGDANHLHHRLMDKIKAVRPTVAIFYFFSAFLCVLTLLMVLEVQSPILRLLTGFLTLGLMLAVIWSLLLYGDRSLFLTLRNRPHFKFLGEFLRFMKMRAARAKSAGDLLALLEAGVKDLDFDRVEIIHKGKAVRKWVNSQPAHPQSPRLSSEESFNGWDLQIKWSQPLHGDDGYNEYLLLTWHRFLTAIKASLPYHDAGLEDEDYGEGGQVL
ncbi:MAG: undecaprenyl/decaprenyl-phosphate alpha-N-acetylglucosaminyl 1-phosphate transferase [Deltaproteobacteria bacterium]|nr:undecaprenyl/decaprenyl-phosphate alpha-N-acetylglucosaminyl 1-phosphate transferase [Deltaproteobacteria bacterium]